VDTHPSANGADTSSEPPEPLNQETPSDEASIANAQAHLSEANSLMNELVSVCFHFGLIFGCLCVFDDLFGFLSGCVSD
jgi:hypothetical protein